MNQCQIGGALGAAGFAEISGSTYTVFDDGLAETTRTFQGPASNVAAFLTIFPEGTPDPEYPNLTRILRTSVDYNFGYAFVSLSFGGPVTEAGEVRPFRITKNIIERSVSLLLSPGLAGDQEGDHAYFDLKYTTLAHTLDYVEGNDNDEAHRFDKAQLPAEPNDAILFTVATPPIKLGATGYIGGNWNAPADRTPILQKDTDYQVFYQPIEYQRSKDRGEYWQFTETWSALVEEVQSP